MCIRDRVNALLLRKSVEGSRSPAVKKLAQAQWSYLDTMARLLEDLSLIHISAAGVFAAFRQRPLRLWSGCPEGGGIPSRRHRHQHRLSLIHIYAAGSTCATKTGAIPALPTTEEIEACRKSVPLLRV